MKIDWLLKIIYKMIKNFISKAKKHLILMLPNEGKTFFFLFFKFLFIFRNFFWMIFHFFQFFYNLCVFCSVSWFFVRIYPIQLFPFFIFKCILHEIVFIHMSCNLQIFFPLVSFKLFLFSIFLHTNNRMKCNH